MYFLLLRRLHTHTRTSNLRTDTKVKIDCVVKRCEKLVSSFSHLFSTARKISVCVISHYYYLCIIVYRIQYPHGNLRTCSVYHWYVWKQTRDFNRTNVLSANSGWCVDLSKQGTKKYKNNKCRRIRKTQASIIGM